MPSDKSNKALQRSAAGGILVEGRCCKSRTAAGDVDTLHFLLPVHPSGSTGEEKLLFNSKECLISINSRQIGSSYGKMNADGN